MILICCFANSAFSVKLQNKKHWSQALVESLRYFLLLSTEKPLIIFKYVFQEPRSKGSRREPWERGWSFSYAELGNNRNSRTRFSDSKGCRKKQAKRKWDARFFVSVSLLEAWAVSFLKVRVTFLSLNQTVRIKRKSLCLTVYEISEVPSHQNSVTSPRYAVTFAKNGNRVPSDLISGRDSMGRGRVFVSVKIF